MRFALCDAMRRPVFTMVLALVVLFTLRCGGEAEEVTPDALRQVNFRASALLDPAAPKPGERIYFNLDVTSSSSEVVNAGVEFIATDETGKEVYKRVWEGVSFKPSDQYALRGSFITDTTSLSVGKTVVVRARVIESADGGVLFESESLATFKTSYTPGAPEPMKPDAGRPDAGRPDSGR